jgi:tetratricopeptide (TPR) repeat protein
MYLKTPKRYRPGYKERRVLNLKWLWLWILTPIIVFVGIQLYERRDAITPPIEQFIQQRVSDAQSSMATMNAPTPIPTENPSDRLIRADNAWQRGAIGRAIEEYANAAPAVPNNVEVFNRMALGHLMEGRNDDSLAAAERAITADPYSSDAWAIRAVALARSGQPERGVASARQALSLRPNSALALAFLGEAYRIAGQTSLALESAEQAIEADPNFYAGYFVRAMINYFSTGEWDTAREDFGIARDLAPTLPYIATEMAWLEWSYDNTDFSMEMLNEVLELDPNNLDALYAIGYFHYQYYGDPEQSLEYLGRCVAADPENVTCLDYLGIVQTVTGDFQSALATYQQLIDTGTQDARYFLRAGNAYINVGDCNGALPVLRTGYEIELLAEEPNTERIAAFESYLGECQPGFVPLSQPTVIPDAEVTEEAGG